MKYDRDFARSRHCMIYIILTKRLRDAVGDGDKNNFAKGGGHDRRVAPGGWLCGRARRPWAPRLPEVLHGARWRCWGCPPRSASASPKRRNVESNISDHSDKPLAHMRSHISGVLSPVTSAGRRDADPDYEGVRAGRAGAPEALHRHLLRGLDLSARSRAVSAGECRIASTARISLPSHPAQIVRLGDRATIETILVG